MSKNKKKAQSSSFLCLQEACAKASLFTMVVCLVGLFLVHMTMKNAEYLDSTKLAVVY